MAFMFQKNLEEISKLQDKKPTSPTNDLHENLKRQIECYDKLFKLGREKEASPFLLFKILKGKDVFIRQCLAFRFRHFALIPKYKGKTLQDKNFFNPRWFQYSCRWIGSFSYDSQQFVFQRCLPKFCQIR
jgi:hypothetical protein